MSIMCLEIYHLHAIRPKGHFGAYFLDKRHILSAAHSPHFSKNTLIVSQKTGIPVYEDMP